MASRNNNQDNSDCHNNHRPADGDNTNDNAVCVDRSDKIHIHDISNQDELAGNAGSKKCEYQWALDFIKKCAERYKDKSIYQYYYARLLIWTGSFEDAILVLRERALDWSDRFWYWTVLADAHHNVKPEIELVYLCKAWTVATDADKPYLRRLEQSLKCRLNEFEPDNAKHDTLIWKHALHAETLIGNEYDWVPAVVIKNESKDSGMKLCAVFLHDMELKQAEGFVALKTKKKLRRGDPIFVKTFPSKINWRILAAKMRSGKPWDVVPADNYVVTKEIAVRGVCVLRNEYGDEINVYVKHWRESRDWHPGMVLTLKVLRDDVGAVLVGSTIAKEFPDFVKSGVDKVLETDSEGGVWLGKDHKIFVPRNLAVPLGLHPGQEVKYVANRQAGKDGASWFALTAARI